MPGAPSAATEGQSRNPKRSRRRFLRRSLLLAFLLAWTAVGLYQANKPLPPGVRVASDWHDVPLEDVRLLLDTTVRDGRGRQIVRQEIFEEMLRVVGAAREFLLLDFFLFNDLAVAPEQGPYRALSSELGRHLVERRLSQPDLRVVLVTDPINDTYGGAPSALLEELRAAGIEVVITDLERLRDSNLAYSALWRMLFGWWDGDARGEGWLPSPLETGPQRLTLRAWLRLLNFKANHRKVIVADDGNGGLVALVTSANPHDASSAHSNIGLRFAGPIVRDVLASEVAVARFSGWSGRDFALPEDAAAADESAGPAVPTARLQFLTEGAIHDALLNAIDTTQRGEAIAIAVFYLAERDVLDALVSAAARDVRVRIILDPNKDAFGRTKDGVPNRPVAAELVRRSGGRIEVRWYRTHGEQFHVKLAMVQRASNLWALLGSANFTRRNLEDFNLEADVALETELDSALARQLGEYFQLLWENDALAVREYTADFPIYEDQSFTRYWRYRLMEATGLSTF